jgi:cytoskeleton protein RodZ
MAQDSTQNRPKISDITEIDTGQSLGSYLQRERLKQQYTLDEIAEQTRINLTTLQAIESNDRHKMPAEVFSKGFIKIYAKFLGLDVQDAMERYDKEMALTDEDSISNHDVFYNEKLAESSIFSLGKLFFCLLLLALIALGYYFFLYSESPQPRRSTLSFQDENQSTATPAMEKENIPRPSSAEQNTSRLPAGDEGAPAPEPLADDATPPPGGALSDKHENILPQPGSDKPQPREAPPLTKAPVSENTGSSGFTGQAGQPSSQ